MSKKILAILMAVAMAFSLLPVTAVAADTTPTPDVVDGYYNANNQWAQGEQERSDELKDTVTTVDKTATKVAGQENQYEVTLNVQMKYKTEEAQPGAAATVLVIDTSGSMNYCTKEEHKHTDDCYQWEECTPQVNPDHYRSWGDYGHKLTGTNCNYVGGRYVYPTSQTCGKEEHTHSNKNCAEPHRIAVAKEAAKNFLNSYRGGTVSEDGKWTPSRVPLNRYISVVWFNKDVSNSEWLDVSTQAGYDTAIRSINDLSAIEGTNLDAGLRMANAQLNNNTVKDMPANVVVLTDGKPTYYLEEATYNPDIEIGTEQYWIRNDGKDCTKATYNKTVSTAQNLRTSVRGVYTVCFGASSEILSKVNGTPTVGTFLKEKVATQPGSGNTQKYAYEAQDVADLNNAFAAISSSVVSGLNTGTVTDALPNGVSCVTDGIFNQDGKLTWQLDPETATKSEPDSDGFITYTYEKQYTVQIDPTAEKLNVVNGCYVPLNLPTTLTVKNSANQDVEIPFPIPAGKVSTTTIDPEPADTYTVTYQWAEGERPSDATLPEGNPFTLNVGEKHSVASIPTSSVTTNAAGKTGTWSCIWDKSGEIEGSAEESIVIIGTWTFQESEVPATGNLTISKRVDGITLDKLDKDFKITVTGAGNYTKDLFLNDNDATKDEANTTATWTISNLPIGTYTVSEENADVSGYTYTAAYTISNETDTEKSVTVTENGGTMTVTNTYTKTEDPKPVDPVKWDVSKSKTATNLDSNYESKVTLSLPSAEETLSSDVVFVLDESDCNEAVLTQMTDLLDNLQKAAQVNNASINVGVVFFRGIAVTAYPMTKYTGDNEPILTAINNAKSQMTLKGTNMPAGLLEAKKMLSDSSTSSSRQYMILVSDGATYIYTHDGDSTTHYSRTSGLGNEDGSLYEWVQKYPGNTDYPFPANFKNGGNADDWETLLKDVASKRDEFIKLDQVYERTEEKKTADLTKPDPIYTEDTIKNFVTNVEESLYQSATTYQQIVESGVNCYSITVEDRGVFTTFSDYLAGLGKKSDMDFTSIKNDILYAVSAGSTVTDTIGDKFTFGGVDSFTLTIGGSQITGTVDGNTVNFGDVKQDGTCPYTVTYTPDTKTFVWTINENVSNFAPVQLTYTVKLIKPEAAAGTYGQTDLNGDTFIDGTQTTVDSSKALYTNEKAALTPVDSQGNPGADLEFPKPSVSYTIKGGNNGGHGGNSKPSLNTKDHYGYIIGYPVDYYTGEPTTDQTKKPVRPEGKITRAEVATIYFRMLTDESRAKFWSQSNAYSDVKAGDWFNNAVSTLSNAGIIAGYEDGSFRPNGYITRAEFATIAARFFDAAYDGKDLFPDISGHWAKDYINQAANKGFVNGYEDGTFRPDRNITRAEAVTLVNRTLERHPDKSHFTKDMLTWPDNMDTTKWYYADMQEATNSHTYESKENSDKSKYENWTKTLSIRNWEALEKEWSNANSSQGTGNVV